MLIDSHCHLKKYFEQKEGERVLASMEEAGVGECITVGTSLDDWDFYYKLARRYPGKVHWTAGMHPCHVEEGWQDQVPAIPTYFATDPLPVALGEIGLDYFHLPKYPDEAAEVKQRQQAAFQRQLEIAYQIDCPVVVHSRNAFTECVKMIDASGVNWERVLFHCFAEGPDEISQLNERGGRGSFTGLLTYKNEYANGVREAARVQGLDKFMLETDSPYLTPEPHRGKRNEPANVRHVAEYAAGLFEVSLEEIIEITTRNTQAFFGLNGK